MPDDKNLRYRYPGTKPFEADEHELFKGRDGDVQSLSELIALNNLVVLFGRSGLGKSSLLNAGLVNRFSGSGTAPLFVRFGACYGANTASPLRKLQDALTTHGSPGNGPNFIYEKLIPKEAVAPHNLWYLFKSRQLARPQEQGVVLIFDQFEELFTYPDADVEAFKKELSEALFVSVPQQLRNVLKEKLRLNPAYLTGEEKEVLFRPLNVKTLFSIRSDKLSLLNGFTDCFPSVLNTCYELKPLSKEQARRAIVEPAGLDDKKYASPPFTFTADAVALLLKALTEAKRGKEATAPGYSSEIETFQLQIVCRHAENAVMEKGLQRITASDLGDIKAIFENHYRNILHKLPEAQRLPAQRLMEEKLVIDGNRVSMPIPFILRDEGMTPGLLDELINTHLLRREQANTVEISHDTLVEPILKRYEERRKEEAVAAELREKEAQINKIRKEQEEQAGLQRQKAKRNRVLMAVISAALLFMMALAGYAVNQSRNANEQKVRAEEQKSRAESNEAEAKKEKEKALANQRKADSLRQIAVKSDSAARAALAYAKIQRAKAESNAAEAEWQATLAKKEKADAERQKDAFRLILVAHEEEENNATVALRIAEAAMNQFHDPLIVNEATHIYLKHDFYKTISRGEPGNLCAFSPDGTNVLLSAYPGVRLLNGQGRQKEFGTKWERETTGYATSVGFGPDGRHFLVGLHNGGADLWNTDSVRIARFKGHRGAVECTAFAPDGKEILTGSADSTAILWNANGDSITTLTGCNGTVRLLAFSPDKKRFLTASDDSTVRLWEKGSSSFRQLKEPFPVTAVTFVTNEKVLVGAVGQINSETGETAGTVRLWNVQDDSTKEIINRQNGLRSVAFSPDGTKILTGHEGGFKLWNDEGEVIKEVKGNAGFVNAMALPLGGNVILTSSDDNTVVRKWIATDVPLKLYEGHKDRVNLAAFSKDGGKFITGSDDGTARVWSTDGALLQTLKNGSEVSSVDISGDGQLLLTASTDNTAKLWNANGKLLHTFEGHRAAVQSAVLAKDKSKVLTGSDDGTAVLWSINGDSLVTFNRGGGGSGITSVAFSPDGTKVLAGSRDGTAKLWNAKGKLLHTFKGHKDEVTAVAFSQGGSRILTGSGDKTAVLWDVNGDSLMRFKGHTDRIWSVAFSPLDSTKILTGSVDRTARIWNAKGDVLRILTGHDDGVSCAVFSPDEASILTTSWDETVKLWKTGPLLTLEEFLKSNAIDKLTPEQKIQFGIQ